jgi:hypothetical protein
MEIREPARTIKETYLFVWSQLLLVFFAFNETSDGIIECDAAHRLRCFLDDFRKNYPENEGMEYHDPPQDRILDMYVDHVLGDSPALERNMTARCVKANPEIARNLFKADTGFNWVAYRDAVNRVLHVG